MVWSRAKPFFFFLMKFPKTFGSRQKRAGFSSELSPVHPPPWSGREGQPRQHSPLRSQRKRVKARSVRFCLRRLSRHWCGKSCLAFEKTCYGCLPVSSASSWSPVMSCGVSDTSTEHIWTKANSCITAHLAPFGVSEKLSLSC